MKTQKNTWMRMVTLLLVFILFSGSAMAQTKANFSGNWQLDLVNSSNLAKDNLKAIVINKDSAAITIKTSVINSENSLRHGADTIYLDGAAHPGNKDKVRDLKLPEGKVSGFTRTSALAWSADGKSLTISTDYILMIDNKPYTVKTVVKWTLDGSGQKLTISGNAGSTTYKDIYTQM